MIWTSRPARAAAGAAGETPLDSWKEIARYLGRAVRTAQTWEKQEGLPVHRHLHRKGSTVYAFPSEIDAWRESRDALARSRGRRPPPWRSWLLALAGATSAALTPRLW